MDNKERWDQLKHVTGWQQQHVKNKNKQPADHLVDHL